MFAVNFYASCLVTRGSSIGKKLIRLDWEKAVYRLLFTIANTLLLNEPNNRNAMEYVILMKEATRSDIQQKTNKTPSV